MVADVQELIVDAGIVGISLKEVIKDGNDD